MLLAACIGNVLEWYDFAIYGGFAAEFGRIFFPSCQIDVEGYSDDLSQAQVRRLKP